MAGFAAKCFLSHPSSPSPPSLPLLIPVRCTPTPGRKAPVYEVIGSLPVDLGWEDLGALLECASWMEDEVLGEQPAGESGWDGRGLSLGVGVISPFRWDARVALPGTALAKEEQVFLLVIHYLQISVLWKKDLF